LFPQTQPNLQPVTAYGLERLKNSIPISFAPSISNILNGFSSSAKYKSQYAASDTRRISYFVQKSINVLTYSLVVELPSGLFG